MRPAAHCPDPGREQQRHKQRRASDDRFSFGTFRPGDQVLLREIGEPLRVGALRQLVDGGRERRTSLLDLALDLDLVTAAPSRPAPSIDAARRRA